MPKLKSQREAKDKAPQAPAVQKQPDTPDKMGGPLATYQATAPAKAERPPPRTPDVMTATKSDAGGAAARARTNRALQRQAGNAHLSRPGGGVVQTKLTVNRPGDAYEQEADRVAAQVMRSQASGSVRNQQGPRPPYDVQRQESSNHVPEVSSDTESYLSRSQGNGRTLPAKTRRSAETQLGRDFSDVRVHDDQTANQAARSLNARAFTHGSDVYLGRGESADDVQLMAHELTHVAQQTGSNGSVQMIQRAWYDPLVESAEWVGGKVASGAETAWSGAEWAAGKAWQAGSAGVGAVRQGLSFVDSSAAAFRRKMLRQLVGDRVVELQGASKFTPDFLMSQYIKEYGWAGMAAPVNVRFGSLARAKVPVQWHPDTGAYEIPKTLLPMQHEAFAADPSKDSLVLMIRASKADSSLSGEMGLLPGLGQSILPNLSGDVDLLLRDENMHRAILGEDYDRGELLVVTFENSVKNGTLRVEFGGLLTVGGGQTIRAAFVLINNGHSWSGKMTTQVKGLAEDEIDIERTGKAELMGRNESLGLAKEWTVKGFGSARLSASYVEGLLDIRGQAELTTDRVRGELTLLVTDEATAREMADANRPVEPAAPAAGGTTPAPAPSSLVADSGLALTGWGALDVTLVRDKSGKDFITGSAAFLLDPDGYVTLKGTIRTEQQFTLVEATTSPWKEHFSTGEWSVWVSVPWAPGGLKATASGGLSSRYTVGPVTLYDVTAEGVYSTDPTIGNEVSISARLNGSAELQGRVDITGTVAARFGTRYKYAGVNVVEVALKLYGLGSLKGYIDVAPTIGLRKPKAAAGAGPKGPAEPEYFIKGAVELGGELDVELGGSIRFAVVKVGLDKTITFGKRPIAGFGATLEFEHTLGQDLLPNVKFKTGKFQRQRFVRAILKEREAKETDALEGGYREDGKLLGAVSGEEIEKQETEAGRVTLTDDFPMSGEPHYLYLELGEPGEEVYLNMESSYEALLYKIEIAKTKLTMGSILLDSSLQKEVEQRLKDLDAIKASAIRVIAAAKKLGVDPTKPGRTRIPGFKALGDQIANYGDRYGVSDLVASLPTDEPSAGTLENPFEITWPKPPTSAYPTLYFGGRIDRPRRQSVLKGLYTKGQKDETGAPVRAYTPHTGGTLPDGERIGISRKYRIYRGRILGPLSTDKTPGGEKLNRILKRYGFVPSEEFMDADHVQEIQFGGHDVVENLWPLDSDVNQLAGPALARGEVTYPKTGRRVKIAELKRRVKRYYVKIKEFNF